MSIDEWENKLFKFINSSINSRLSPLPNESISRENTADSTLLGTSIAGKIPALAFI
ncbi:hypothetical protein CYANOKiyG1_06670 [Okeania sp. KiyG1]|nr:hypothetical protein CYANOKiyG1_06670 [Okeania sp. KiyG1]